MLQEAKAMLCCCYGEKSFPVEFLENVLNKSEWTIILDVICWHLTLWLFLRYCCFLRLEFSMFIMLFFPNIYFAYLACCCTSCSFSKYRCLYLLFLDQPWSVQAFPKYFAFGSSRSTKPSVDTYSGVTNWFSKLIKSYIGSREDLWSWELLDRFWQVKKLCVATVGVFHDYLLILGIIFF